MSELSLFVTAPGPDPTGSFEFDGQSIRTMTIDGEPWFAAVDVCAVLGIVNMSDALTRLNAADIGTADVWSPSNNRQYPAKIVTESGLYDLILDSRKPNARRFRRWVTAEVLPAIRRTGQYVPAPRVPQTLAEALQLAADQARQVEALEQARRELEPRAQGYDTWVATGVTVEIGAAAKVLASFGVKVGRTRLYRDLRAQGWVFQNSTEPMQGAVEAGYVVVEFGKAYLHPKTGETVSGEPRTRLTPKGLERLLSHRYGVPVSDAFRSAVAAAGEA